jgi:hypothetical protein
MPINETSPELLPRHLPNEYIEDPREFLFQLFDFAHLPQLRDMLREWFACTITGSWHQQSVDQREDMLMMYEKMEQLLEVAHLLYKLHPLPAAAGKGSAATA